MSIDLLNEMRYNPKSLTVIETLAISALLSQEPSIRASATQQLAGLYDGLTNAYIEDDQIILLFDRNGREVPAYLCNIPSNAKDLPRYSLFITQ